MAVLSAAACMDPASLPQKSAATAVALERMPEISGVDHRGTEYSLEAALEKGPVVVIFYRGHW